LSFKVLLYPEMKITYLIGAKKNPLYEDNFKINGRYLTFGHHSFCYDLVVDLQKRVVELEVLTDDLDVFPLTDVFGELNVNIKSVDAVANIVADLIIIDSVSDVLLSHIEMRGLKVGIIHDYMKFQSALFYSFCDKIICLTETAKQRQSTAVDASKILVITQGIDLNRFTKAEPSGSRSALIYSRMDTHKGSIYIPIIDKLIENNFSINVLGSGKYFDYIAEKYKNGLTCHPHIPCYEIQDFVKRFDLIISNGRGVMEGMASGKPTIAAGVRYCGLLDHNNIEFFFERNFTGSNSIYTVEKMDEDLNFISNHTPEYFRLLAEKYFDVSGFTEKLLALRTVVAI
jgi:glycosyltransferase involved in cell wall biosynthesis